MIRRPTDFMAHAACLGKDPEIFFPSVTAEEGKGSPRDDEAKAICAGCPVRQACLDYALDGHEVWGIWGGTDRRERTKIRKTRPEPFRCPQCGTVFHKIARGYGGGSHEDLLCSDQCRAARHAAQQAAQHAATRDEVHRECVVCGVTLSLTNNDTCNQWCRAVKDRRTKRKATA